MKSSPFNHSLTAQGISQKYPMLHGTSLITPKRWCTQAEILEQFEYRDDPVARRMFLDNGMDGRYMSLPPEQFKRTSEPGFQQQVFQHAAVSMAEEAVRDLLEAHAIDPQEVGAIVTLTTYGFVVPSISACLVQRLGLRRDIKKFDLGGAGCLGGVSLLEAAASLADRQRGEYLVAVSSEVGSLFMRDSPASERGKMVINALMGDASVALLLGRSEPCKSRPHAHIVDTQYTSDPETLDAVDIRTAPDGTMTGHIRTSVPSIAGKLYQQAASSLLERHGLSLEEISHWALHPGSRLVIESVTDALRLRSDQVALSREVLRRYGNVCSATALAALHEHLQTNNARAGDWGIVGGVGPGMTVGLTLLRWI